MLLWINVIKLSLFYVPFQRIGYSFKKDEIENSIVHRVQGVFRRASAKWKVSDQNIFNYKKGENMYCIYYDINIQMYCLFLDVSKFNLIMISVFETTDQSINKIDLITLQFFFEDSTENAQFDT